MIKELNEELIEPCLRKDTNLIEKIFNVRNRFTRIFCYFDILKRWRIVE